MEPSAYREIVRGPIWLSLIFLAIIGVTSVILVVQTIYGIPIGNRPAPTLLLIGLDVLFIFLAWNFYVLDIRIDRKKLRVSFGFIRKVILIEDMVSCNAFKARFRSTTGLGIRLSRDGSLAFIISFGGAVKVEKKTGRPFIFSSKNPDEVAKFINKLMENR